MRHFLFSLLCLVLIAPTSAVAQTNVKKAFDKLIESKSADCSETSKSERDPSTGELEAMSDVIDFTIPEKDFDLIRNIESAFKQDSPKSYGFYSGLKGRRGADNMAVSTGGDSSVDIILYNGSNYTYALFLDPKKSDKFRYAYCLSYIKAGKEYKGRLVISYSTTLKYRQSQKNTRRTGRGTATHAGKKWIDNFLEQIAVLESYNGNESGITYALTQIYSMCSDLPADLPLRDKKLAFNILSEKRSHCNYNTTNTALLTGCLDCLK